MQNKKKNFLNFIKDEVKGINGYAVAGMMAISLSLFAFKNGEEKSVQTPQKFHPASSLNVLADGRVQFSGSNITGQNRGENYRCNDATAICTVEGQVQNVSGSTVTMLPGYSTEEGAYQVITP